MSQTKNIFLFLLLFPCMVYSQQDVNFNINSRLLIGKTVLRVKRDFNDPYLWALAKNNQVYRINSITMQVDDYTSIFSSYSNLQFVDIAGKSKDTVLIATKSANLIQFKNGSIKLIGRSQGLPDTINSIGIDYADNSPPERVPPTSNNHFLFIGTKRGLYQYEIDPEILSLRYDNFPDSAYSKVFEATYRNEIYSGSTEFNNIIDTITYLPIDSKTQSTGVHDIYLWEGKEFGYNIMTAYRTSGVMDPGGAELTSLDEYFWGTEKGMTQIRVSETYWDQGQYNHYLNGVTVNKITSIYGLTSFANPNNPFGESFVKENLLIGTTSGFYFSSSLSSDFYNPLSTAEDLYSFTLTHDDQLGNININDICVNPAVIQYPVCENGVWLATDDGLYFLTPDYSQYISSQVVQAISFQGEPDSLAEMQLCPGNSINLVSDSVTFANTIISWYKNGQLLNGQNSKQINISSTGDYYAILNDPCSHIQLTTNHLKVDSGSAPVITFNYPDTLNYCAGNTLTLTARGNAAYHYRWYKNDTLNTDTASTLTVNQTGKYKIEVSACTNSWVPSKQVQVNFVQLPIPVITANKTNYCLGDQATLNLKIPTDPSYTITWLRDGAPVDSYQNLTNIVTSIPGDYTVSVGSIIIGNCLQVSIPLQVIFNPPPAVSIQQIINTTLCAGQTIGLKALYSGGTIKWSTGETTDQISVFAPGVYHATVTSAAGCIADTSINVQFLPNPVLAVKDTSLCESAKQPISLIAPVGFSKYVWNNQPGTNTFLVTYPQTVSLTVTDVNGCEASQQIVVGNQCADVMIPNAFTPNGDGINDNWVIIGIEGDPSTSVRIFNRYGMQIYQKNGYYNPWNGQYNGKKLPTGVYYYIITAKNGREKFSGSVSIIY